MSFFEAYCFLTVFLIITWPLLAFYQYKNGKGSKEFDSAIEGLKESNASMCDSLGITLGSFALALLYVSVLSLFAVSIPIVVAIRLFRKIVNS